MKVLTNKSVDAGEVELSVGNVQSFTEIPVQDAYKFFYNQEITSKELEIILQVLPSGIVSSMSDMRRMIMRLDRQTYPTSAILRFNEDDLEYVKLANFTLAIDKSDIAVSSGISASKSYEPHLSGVFSRYIKKDWRVVDIGANIGYFSMLARSLVGPKGEVLSFEPYSENSRLILLSCMRNNFENVRLFPFALSDHIGHAYFTSAIGSNGGMLASNQERLEKGMGLVVPTVRLDSLIQAPVDFIKMDTEGSEYRILRGCQGLLASCRPIVSTEFSVEMLSRVSGINPRDHLSLFLSYGYILYVIDQQSGRLNPVGDIDDFLSSWGDISRIEDLIALPLGTPVLQP